MEHSPGQITCEATKQTLLNLRKLKQDQASFVKTLGDYKTTTRKKLEKKKKPTPTKQMEAKQYATK